MHDTLTLAATRDMLMAVAARMVESTDHLTAVDQAIGDGDHGIGMRRGFTAVLEQMQGPPAASIQALVKSAGMAIMAKTGGAAGAVFGTFFTAGSAALADCDAIDGAHFAKFLQLGLEGVEKRGGAEGGPEDDDRRPRPCRQGCRGGPAEDIAGRHARGSGRCRQRRRGDQGHDRHNRQGAHARRALTRTSRPRSGVDEPDPRRDA